MSFMQRVAWLGLTPMPQPGIFGAGILSDQICKQLYKVRVRKKACKALGDYCVQVSKTLQQRYNLKDEELSPSQQQIFDNLWETFVDIEEKSRIWGAYNPFLGFLYHSEVEKLIKSTQAKLSAHLQELGLSGVVRQQSWDVHFQQAGEMDGQVIVDTQNRQNEMEQTTKDLQDRLSKVQAGTVPRSSVDEARRIRERLYQMRTQPPDESDTSVLPYRELTTSEVRKSGNRSLHVGDTYDIWLGKLYERQRVVLKVFRGSLPSSDGSQQQHLTVHNIRQNKDNERRWNRQVDIWRSLRHDNILQLYGVVTLPPLPGSTTQKQAEVALVVPFMKNRDAAAYFSYKNEATKGADRMKFIIGIGRGLKYLHNLGIVHGGLQGSKVLVSDDGSAVLSDFTVSKLMSDNPLFTGNQGATQAIRWLAPEASENQVLTAQADVYSWGMTALQVLSGRQPFYKMKTVGSLIIAFRDKAIKPDREDYTPSDHIDDNLWDLLTACWSRNPKDRPTIDGVLKALEANVRDSQSMSE